MLDRTVRTLGYFYNGADENAVIVHKNDGDVIVDVLVFLPHEHMQFHDLLRDCARSEGVFPAAKLEMLKASELGNHVQFSLVDDMKLTHLLYHDDRGVPSEVAVYDLTKEWDRRSFCERMRAVIFEQITMK